MTFRSHKPKISDTITVIDTMDIHVHEIYDCPEGVERIDFLLQNCIYL